MEALYEHRGRDSKEISSEKFEMEDIKVKIMETVSSYIIRI